MAVHNDRNPGIAQLEASIRQTLGRIESGATQNIDIPPDVSAGEALKAFVKVRDEADLDFYVTAATHRGGAVDGEAADRLRDDALANRPARRNANPDWYYLGIVAT